MAALLVIVLLLKALHTSTGTSFIFPLGQPNIYNGYVWENADHVHLSPRLQAVPDYSRSASGKICGISIYNSDGSISPLTVTVLDPISGLADIPINDLSELNLRSQGTTVFSMQAYDCDSPPHVSERVPLSIHVVEKRGPFFAQASYEFTVSQNSYAGSVVGPVQAIQQLRRDEDPMVSAICAYRLHPIDLPFTVDRYGVLRVKQKLQSRPNNRPYTFNVIAEDCHRPVPLTASVEVIVKQITDGCQPGWTGMLNYLELSGGIDRPEKIFKFHNMQLNMCADGCPGQEEVQVRLELRSAIQGYTLKTATADACSQTPEQLSRQWTLCDLHVNTLKTLLPDPMDDLASQLIGPTIGNPPILTVPTMSWRFDSQSHTVWEIDPKYLNNEGRINAFDTDFTLMFWLRRGIRNIPSINPDIQNEEEIILCSQDRQETDWRFFSVSLQSCRLIIRLLALWEYTSGGLDVEARKPTVWTLGPLPTEYCAPNEGGNGKWHHYAVTFDRASWSPTSEPVSLLIDGQDVGVSEHITTTLLPAIPPFTFTENIVKPKVTLGACYDPLTHLTGQHLNGELAGVTLLLGQTEAPNNIRCVAQCGESLLVPNIMKHLQSDVRVRLESDAINITGHNMSHVLDVLQTISYVRPQPGMSPDYAPYATQARLLNLSTTYRCPNSVEITLPHTEIQLSVLPQPRNRRNPVQASQPINKPSGSVWVDEGAYDVRGPGTLRKSEAMAEPLGDIQQTKPPVLMIQGSDIIITDPTIGKEGIPLFPDIQFQLPNDDMEATMNYNNHQAAEAVPLEDCLVWIASSEDPTNPSSESGLHYAEGERIDWPVDLVVQLGLSGTNDNHGVKLHGRKPAGLYERLLRTLHYFPPNSVLTDEESREAGTQPYHVKYIATVGLVCSTDSGSHMTNEFSVKVLFETPEYIDRDLSNNNAIRKPSPKTFISRHTFAGSNQEQIVPVGKSRNVREAEPQNTLPATSSKKSKSSGSVTVALFAAIAIAILLLVVVAIIVFVRKRTRRRNTQSSAPVGHRRRFPARPADFGGSNLKLDPTLRLTANPIGEMEYTGLGTVREDMYGSSRELPNSHSIFSPPLIEEHGDKDTFSANARLAGLEEFDEEYTDEASEDLCSEDDSGHYADEQTALDDLATSQRKGPPVGVTPSYPEAHETEVYAWLSDDDAIDGNVSEVIDCNGGSNRPGNGVKQNKSVVVQV